VLDLILVLNILLALKMFSLWSKKLKSAPENKMGNGENLLGA
jgi:hypothetical protein